MARIFIGYRRDDSAGHAGRLRDWLSQRFGAGEIFRDIDTIPPGVDFVEAIEAAVGSCEVLLVVIGPRWLTAADSRGRRRLDNPEDFVRLEIAAALERKIRVIPVLVHDATMPRSDELPPPLAGLARWNALELRDATWDYDVGRLVAALETIIPPQPARETDTLMAQLIEAEAQKDWDTVIAVGEQILKLDSNHTLSRRKTAEAYKNRGEARYDEGDSQGALADYNQAIRLDRNFAAAYANRGNVLYDQGNVEGALKDYDRAIRLDPNDAAAYINRGNARYNQGEFRGAIVDYDQAIRLDPNNADAYYNRGLVHLAKRNRVAAWQDFERAAQLGDEDARNELARL